MKKSVVTSDPSKCVQPFELCPIKFLTVSQDVKSLKLTLNPALIPDNPVSEPTERPQFVCPLTLKEMNGVHPFVYLRSCGDVFSQAGLKTVAAGSSSPKEGEEETDRQLEVCPQCATKYDKFSDILLLNPSVEEEERMFTAMILLRASEPTKKSKKRKNIPTDADTPAPKFQKTAQPHTNPSISAASKAVVSSLAMEEAKRKAGMSDAVKSLYGNGKSRKETFMTMGTFTRVSDCEWLGLCTMLIWGPSMLSLMALVVSLQIIITTLRPFQLRGCSQIQPHMSASRRLCMNCQVG